ncbi:hypothetical protein C8A01DRAFT_41399, partial [Parachaetomium inaequale]
MAANTTSSNSPPSQHKQWPTSVPRQALPNLLAANNSTTRASETAAAIAAPATPTSVLPGASTTTNSTNATALAAHIGPYIPGSMPPPRISLRQPRNGTTGYIIDRIMMPRSLPHFSPGHKQTVAIYYIGYRDRPIERGLVPHNEILQHVSLRELEEWEDQLPQMIEENRREDAE